MAEPTSGAFKPMPGASGPTPGAAGVPGSGMLGAGMLGRTARDIAEAVRTGRCSAATVARAHLDHLAAVEPRLRAYVRVLHADALADAARTDAHPDRASLPLAGVPVAVKDIVDVVGHPTRHGSAALPGGAAAADDPLVAALREAGATVLGKTRCPELSIWGTSDDAEGTAISPWAPERTAGGSSGGSGAAVAAGTVALALASDGLGSVRIPAAANGVVGIRPGPDLLAAKTGNGDPHWFGMTRYGPIATTVADTALALSVLTGSPELARIHPVDHALRVAVSWRAPAPVPVAAAIRDAVIGVGWLLHGAGHRVRRAEVPYDLATTSAVLSRWTQGAASDVAELGATPRLLQRRTRVHAGLGRALARLLPVRQAQARRWRDQIMPLLTEHDVLITPMLARPQPAAAAWHRRGWMANIASNFLTYPFPSAWNLADVPALSVPIGTAGNPPIAAQLVAAPGREKTLLAVAAHLEALAPWRRHPPGWGLPVPA